MRKLDPAAIHPELRPLLPWLGLLELPMSNLKLMRRLGRLARAPRLPGGVTVEDRRIARPDGTSLRVRLYLPAQRVTPSPAVLHIHGGGYLIGAPEMDDMPCAETALALGAPVASVDYRLAPEAPFPAALEDCYAALAWLNQQAGGLGIDPARVAVVGNSAGGGLAAALAQCALDRGEFRLAFQALLYPMLDDRTVTRPGLDRTAYRLWTADNNRLGWQSYLGQAPGLPETPPYAVPARRAELRGLPPAWLGIGTRDLFYEEDLAYAQRLIACGVPCQLVEVPGAFHGFDAVLPQSQVARGFMQSRLAAMKQGLE